MFDMASTTSRRAPTARLLHITDAAAELGISAPATRELIDSGELPATLIAGRTYIPADGIDDYVARIVADRQLARIAAKARIRAARR